MVKPERERPDQGGGERRGGADIVADNQFLFSHGARCRPLGVRRVRAPTERNQVDVTLVVITYEVVAKRSAKSDPDNYCK